MNVKHTVLLHISMSDLSHDILFYNPYAYNVSFTSSKLCDCSEGAVNPQSLLVKIRHRQLNYFAFRYSELAITSLINR
jgi:hypothetical protein